MDGSNGEAGIVHYRPIKGNRTTWQLDKVTGSAGQGHVIADFPETGAETEHGADGVVDSDVDADGKSRLSWIDHRGFD